MLKSPPFYSCSYFLLVVHAYVFLEVLPLELVMGYSFLHHSLFILSNPTVLASRVTSAIAYNAILIGMISMGYEYHGIPLQLMSCPSSLIIAIFVIIQKD